MAREQQDSDQKYEYSVWAFPPEDVSSRLANLMAALRSEFGGPQFQPHVTVIGAIRLSPDDALSKLRSACEGLKAYDVTADRVDKTLLLIHRYPQVVEARSHFCTHFGYDKSTPYMPHLSLLYGDLTDEERQKVKERANILDDSLSGLSFQVSRLALYKTDTADKTLESWEKIAEYTLSPN